MCPPRVGFPDFEEQVEAYADDVVASREVENDLLIKCWPADSLRPFYGLFSVALTRQLRPKYRQRRKN
jgi:hypothetical protein